LPQGPAIESKRDVTFNVQAFLNSAGVAKTIVEYQRGDAIFTQGDPCESFLYIQKGRVKVSTVSKTGREVIVAVLGVGDFFGEGGLAGQPVRMGNEMARLLHHEHALSDWFIARLLVRNIRIEGDLVDQFFSTSEKRLARKLLLLARYGDQHDTPAMPIPTISQEALATMIGTTRSRVNFFMKKFQRLGFIDYTDGLKVKKSLLSVVLHD